MKLLLDILSRVRKKVGKEYPVSLRMVGHQYAEGGLTLEDTRIIARRAEEAGASVLHVIAGSPASPYWHTPPMAIPRGCHAALAAEIKKVVTIPVIAVGRIHDPILANQILKEGKADLVAMGRALIARSLSPFEGQGRADGRDPQMPLLQFLPKAHASSTGPPVALSDPEVGRNGRPGFLPAPP